MPIDYIFEGTPPKLVPGFPSTGWDKAVNIFYVSDAAEGVWVPIGGGPGGGPVILVSEAFIDTTSPHSISITAPAIQMYAISIYMSTRGFGTGGQTVTATVSYTAADGSGLQRIDLMLPLDTPNVVMETYPLLCLANTPISISTVYQGAYDPSYTIAASIVQMPTSVQP